jgi:hypothetical protein
MEHALSVAPPEDRLEVQSHLNELRQTLQRMAEVERQLREGV